MDARQKKLKMAAPNSDNDQMPRSEALQTLGLNVDADADAVRAAFRARVRLADPARHGGCDARLRRLLLARDLLTQPVKTLAQPYLNSSLSDHSFELRISLDVALTGGDALLQAPVRPDAPAGLVSMRQQWVQAPRGLRDGECVRLPTREGDWVTVRVSIDTPPDRRVWGDDIWMTASLPPHVLRFGGRTQIDTPYGVKTLRLTEGAQDGASLRLKGLGLPATATAPAGDLIVRLQADRNAAPAAPCMLTAFRERWAS